MIEQFSAVCHLVLMHSTDHHPNRGLHNWLIYRKFAAYLDAHADRITGTVYDLGCGDSPYRDLALRQGDSYTGIDWENSLHSPRADVIADLNQPIDLPTASADTILCVSVLEHLRRPEAFLQEAARLLKPGGVLLLQVPWQWTLHEMPYDYFRYSPPALTDMLTDSGLRDIKISALGGFFTAQALKLNYFSKRFVRGPAPLRWLITMLLLPIWTIDQLLAPLLDHLDRNWPMETSGYFVVAVR
jgi:SAM-dependent methyltransferase